MDISIRGYIKNNFKNSNTKELQTAIEESIKENEEETLPGLGVFFEMMWKNSKEEEKNKIIENILQELK